jgi:hypothetical protein
MSSPDQAPPPVPDDDDYSPELAPPGSTPSPGHPSDAAVEQADPDRDALVRSELVRRTELIAAEARAIAQAQARQAEHLVDLQLWSEDPRVSSRLHGNPEGSQLADRNAGCMTADQARAAAYSRWEDRDVARRTIVSETACLLRVAERTVERMMDQSLWLLSAPATYEALCNGEISYRHATALVDQMRTMPDAEQAAFEESVLPVARTLPVGRFTDKARRLREKLHPESIVTRTKNALAERRTYWEAAADGMGWLHWYGTAEQTKGACDRINGLAVSLKRAGDPTVDGSAEKEGTPGGTDAPTTGSGAAFGMNRSAAELPVRTLDQLRADITAALLLNGVTPTGMGAGIRGTVMVTVPVLSLLGLDEEPATLEGYGPISPETAREIAGHASSFTRLLTHPESGVVLSLGKTQYKNTKAMKKWLRVRDETCRFPGCSRPAVTSDIDHTNAWADGGTTDSDNLAHLCEAHHRLKHLSQWSVKQEADGVLLWTSPGERSYRTDPANPMGPPRPRPPVVGTKTRKRPAEDSYLTPRHQPKGQPSPPPPENPPF